MFLIMPSSPVGALLKLAEMFEIVSEMEATRRAELAGVFSLLPACLHCSY